MGTLGFDILIDWSCFCGGTLLLKRAQFPRIRATDSFWKRRLISTDSSSPFWHLHLFLPRPKVSQPNFSPTGRFGLTIAHCGYSLVKMEARDSSQGLTPQHEFSSNPINSDNIFRWMWGCSCTFNIYLWDDSTAYTLWMLIFFLGRFALAFDVDPLDHL